MSINTYTYVSYREVFFNLKRSAFGISGAQLLPTFLTKCKGASNAWMAPLFFLFYYYL